MILNFETDENSDKGVRLLMKKVKDTFAVIESFKNKSSNDDNETGFGGELTKSYSRSSTINEVDKGKAAKRFGGTLAQSDVKIAMASDPFSMENPFAAPIVDARQSNRAGGPSKDIDITDVFVGELKNFLMPFGSYQSAPEDKQKLESQLSPEDLQIIKTKLREIDELLTMECLACGKVLLELIKVDAPPVKGAGARQRGGPPQKRGP